jgi:hypothetical protein
MEYDGVWPTTGARMSARAIWLGRRTRKIDWAESKGVGPQLDSGYFLFYFSFLFSFLFLDFKFEFKFYCEFHTQSKCTNQIPA